MLFSSFVLPLYGYAQVTIQGRVVDSNTRNGLPFANVFINNTTIGQTTSESGYFKLTNPSGGIVDLVVTYMGYESFTIKINSDTLKRSLLILMNPKSVELQEVKISRLKDGFEKYFPTFRENFIGKTGFSESCKLKNPKILWFSLNDNDTELSAFANQPLIVENKALGYIIKYNLEDFRLNFRTNYVSLLGYVLFEEMTTKSEKQKKTWEANRKKAYYGSSQHFFKSLVEQKITQEGFSMYTLIRKRKKFITMPRIPEKRDSTGAVIRPASRETVFLDSTDLAMGQDTTLKKVQSSDFSKDVQYLVNKPLEEKSIVAAEAGHFRLAFENYLYVVYNKEYEEPQFLRYHQPNMPQVSIITLLDDFTWVESNGFLPDPLAIVVEGRWANEKIGELLPLDYLP
jgi:hypothetical protein